jgi:WD40 repeat protein
MKLFIRKMPHSNSSKPEICRPEQAWRRSGIESSRNSLLPERRGACSGLRRFAAGLARDAVQLVRPEASAYGSIRKTFAVLTLLVSATIAGLPIADAQDLPLPVADLKRTDAVDFGKEIMPILKRNCLACHHEKEAEGGLNLETSVAIHEGGDSGPGAVAKDPAASLLLVRASGAEEPLMPPEDNSVGAKPLTPDELGLLKLWIEQGAIGGDSVASDSIDWQPIPESLRAVYAMDVSPDGQFAAIARANRVVMIDLATNQEVGRLVDPSLTVGEVADVDLIHSIAFSPGAGRVATGGFRTVRIWRKTAPSVDPSTSPIFAAAGLITTKSDQTAVALVNAIGDIEVWNLAENQRLHTLTGHTERPTGLVWAGDTDRIYSCDPTGRLISWQASSGQQLSDFDTKSVITSLATSGDSTSVAAIDANGKAQLFRVSADGKSIERTIDALGGFADATAVTFAEKPAPVAIVASQAGGIVILALADQKVIRKIDHGGIVDALAVSGDQAKLVSGGRDGKTRIWNLADGKPLLTMQGDPTDQLRLAAADRDAARQKAAVERLNKQTAELEKLLTKENEALAKVTEAHKKATESLAAEGKKRVDAVAVVTTTEANNAKAGADATKAAEMIAAATKTLAERKSAAEVITKEIETQKTALASAQQAATDAQKQLAAITKTMNEAIARAAQIDKVIADKSAAIAKANEEAAAAKGQIDSATKMAAAAKSTTEKTTKELETQKKTVATAEAAKTKAEAELAKRNQALDTSTGAQQRASAAIPAHKSVIESETRRRGLLDSQLADAQARITGYGNEVVGVAVSRDSAQIATAHGDGSVRTYRASDGQPISDFHSSSRSSRLSVAFVGNLICGFGNSTSASLWSPKSEWTLERTIGSINDPSIISDRVTALDFRQDGITIAVGSGPPSRSGEVKVFSVESGQLVRDFGPVHSDTVLGLAFSPDQRYVASSAADKTIRLLDIPSGKVTRSLEGHTHHVLSIAWQDDGQTLASASADKNVKIWNVETGEQRRTISGFSKEITAVTFVQQSNQIVTACADGLLRLYDTSNGKAIRTFNASGDFLFTLSVTPDGKKLLAGGQSGNVRIWTLADGKLVHELK